MPSLRSSRLSHSLNLSSCLSFPGRTEGERERVRERERRERERERASKRANEQTSKRAEGGEGGNCAHAPCSPQPRYSMKDTAASVFVASWSGTNARNSQSYMHEAASASSMEAWHWKKRSKSVGMQSCIAVKDCSIHETQRNS